MLWREDSSVFVAMQISQFVYSAAAAANSLQSCPTLCDPIDGSPPGSPVPGILQARTLEWLHFLLQCMKVKSESDVAQSCLTLSDPVDFSLPGSSIHGIFQARFLEWGAIAFSKGTLVLCNHQKLWKFFWEQLKYHCFSESVIQKAHKNNQVDDEKLYLLTGMVLPPFDALRHKTLI